MAVSVPHDVINDVIISDGQNQYLYFHCSTFLILTITKPEQTADVSRDVIIGRWFRNSGS